MIDMQPMRPAMLSPHPPMDFAWIEIVYFLVIFALCLIIYFRTKEIYSLTKHKGIKYFRNTFLFFAFAFSFRLFTSLFFIFRGFSSRHEPFHLMSFAFTFIAYFSSLAILSLTLSLIWKQLSNIKINLDLFMHLFVLLLTLIMFLTASFNILIFIQLVVFVFSVVLSFIVFAKTKRKSFFSKMHLVYLFLFILWFVNLLGPMGNLFDFYNRGFVYTVTALIFVYIVYKVIKRTSVDGKKKG